MTKFERGDRVTFNNGMQNGIVEGAFDAKCSTGQIEMFYVLKTFDGQLYMGLIPESQIKLIEESIPTWEIVNILKDVNTELALFSMRNGLEDPKNFKWFQRRLRDVLAKYENVK